MHLPAFRDHQAERRADQRRVRFLFGEVVACLVMLAAMAAAVLL